MKIGTIVTATDTNPLYLEFLPMFVRAWKHVLPEADIRIVLIADAIPDAYKDYASSIVLMPPLPNIHTAFQAQCIRMLYPRTISRDEGVLITDMDMIPLNRRYYTDNIRAYSSSAFIVYRNVCLPVSEISMCYNVAHPSVWRSIFGEEPIDSLLQRWYETSGYDGRHGGKGWNTDQLLLYSAVMSWKGDKVILADEHTGFRRLDRTQVGRPSPMFRQAIQQGMFADYHCLRPYSTYKQQNDFLVECLLESKW